MMCSITQYISFIYRGNFEWPKHRFYGLLPRVIRAVVCSHVQIVGTDKVLTNCLVWTAKAPVSHQSIQAIVDTAHTTHAVVFWGCTLDFVALLPEMCCQDRFFCSALCFLPPFYFLHCSVFLTVFTLVQMLILIGFLFWHLDFWVEDCLAVYLPPLRAFPHHSWRAESKIPPRKHFYKDWNKCAA